MSRDIAATDSHVLVRDAAVDDWRTVRRLRLIALRSAPEAFWSTYDQEAEASDERWQERVRTGTWFIARLGSDPVGLAALIEDGDMVQVVAMWVIPQARGRGVGAALIQHAVGLACGRGADAVALWVSEKNSSARRLYERSGFTATGNRQVMPGGDRYELQMARMLP